jgi:Zn finger protein HypA/HybF involved in hydrogenase expression
MTYTEEDLKLAVIESTSFAQVLVRLGKTKTGASYQLIQQKIEKLGFDTSHFCKSSHNRLRTKRHYTEVLVDDGKSYRESAKVLRRALTESGREYKCEKCKNNGIWMNDDIVLEVDHIDGNWQNNTKENLRFMCPNCHSQTSNFYNKKEQKYCNCGKPMFRLSTKCHDCSRTEPRLDKRKVERPSAEQLMQDLAELKFWVQIGKKYGVSDNAVRKWARKYKLI